MFVIRVDGAPIAPNWRVTESFPPSLLFFLKFFVGGSVRIFLLAMVFPDFVRFQFSSFISLFFSSYFWYMIYFWIWKSFFFCAFFRSTLIPSFFYHFFKFTVLFLCPLSLGVGTLFFFREIHKLATLCRLILIWATVNDDKRKVDEQWRLVLYRCDCSLVVFPCLSLKLSNYLSSSLIVELILKKFELVLTGKVRKKQEIKKKGKSTQVVVFLFLNSPSLLLFLF